MFASNNEARSIFSGRWDVVDATGEIAICMLDLVADPSAGEDDRQPALAHHIIEKNEMSSICFWNASMRNLFFSSHQNDLNDGKNVSALVDIINLNECSVRFLSGKSNGLMIRMIKRSGPIEELPNRTSLSFAGIWSSADGSADLSVKTLRSDCIVRNCENLPNQLREYRRWNPRQNGVLFFDGLSKSKLMTLHELDGRLSLFDFESGLVLNPQTDTDGYYPAASQLPHLASDDSQN